MRCLKYSGRLGLGGVGWGWWGLGRGGDQRCGREGVLEVVGVGV